MEIKSLLTSDLWFRFSNEEMYWGYVLIEDWNYSGIWICREGIMYRKGVREIG